MGKYQFKKRFLSVNQNKPNDTNEFIKEEKD